MAENRPLAAGGMITRMAVCQGVAPAPRDAAAGAPGTAERASSLMV